MSTTMVIALVALLAATACALTGVFLVLRRMAMMADAISHAVLPGLVAGYVLARGPNLLAGFFGAAAARQWTHSLSRMLLLSGLFGAASGVLGAIISVTGERLPTGPIIILIVTSLFLVSLFFGSERGLAAQQRLELAAWMRIRLPIRTLGRLPSRTTANASPRLIRR